jgi:hypothetical protein
VCPDEVASDAQPVSNFEPSRPARAGIAVCFGAPLHVLSVDLRRMGPNGARFPPSESRFAVKKPGNAHRLRIEGRNGAKPARTSAG